MPVATPAPPFSSHCLDGPEFSSNATVSRDLDATVLRFNPIELCAEDQVSYTRQYAAPELLEAPPGREGQNVLMYDERVDYYSLGVMLRELALDVGRDEDLWERASEGGWRAHEIYPDCEFVDFTDEVRFAQLLRFIEFPLMPFTS